MKADHVFESNSSSINTVTYNSTDSIMTIFFHSGKTASYEMGRTDFLNFVASDSLGKTYNSEIRGVVQGVWSIPIDDIANDLWKKYFSQPIPYPQGRLYVRERPGSTDSTLKDNPVNGGYEVTIHKTSEETSIIGDEFLADAIRELQKTEGVTIVSVKKL